MEIEREREEKVHVIIVFTFEFHLLQPMINAHTYSDLCEDCNM